MTRSAIQRFLARHRKIGLDTGIFIYQAEGHPKYVELTRAVFGWLESRAGRAKQPASLRMTGHSSE